jgi:hypothetical protein
MNLNTFESVLAVKSNCDAKTQSVFGCHLGSDNNEGSVAVAVASKTIATEKEIPTTGIDTTESTSDSSVTISENNNYNTNSNIEPQIPSTISAIPFP